MTYQIPNAVPISAAAVSKPAQISALRPISVRRFILENHVAFAAGRS